MPRPSSLCIFEDGTLILSTSLGPRGAVVGRDPATELTLPHSAVSNRHCKFFWDDETLLLEDLGSTHGTRLNGRRIKQVEVLPGDEIRIGVYCLRVGDSTEDQEQSGSGSGVPGNPPDGISRLARLSNQMVGITDLEQVLETLLDQTMVLAGARRGFIVLAHEDRLSPIVSARGGPTEDDEGERSFSRTLCHRALRERRVIQFDPRSPDFDLKSAQSLRASSATSVVAIPLSSGDRELGILYMELLGGDALESGPAESLWKEAGNVGGKALCAALERRQLVRCEERWRWLATRGPEGPELATTWESPAMQRVTRILEQVAREDITVLIQGESGTGKEIAARTLHRWSRRSGGPFVAVNCGAIPRELMESVLFGHEKGAFTGADSARAGRFELAEGGLLLLDEIGELPKDMQVKLLRVLESRRLERVGGRQEISWDARVLAATNRNLEQAVAEGEFREDLYYRLNVFALTIPPLRDRIEDLPRLASEILRDCNRKFQTRHFGISPEALTVMQRYRWPGNIRELRNVLERAFVIETSDRITPDSLPFGTMETPPASKVTEGLIDASREQVLSLAEFVRGQEREYISLVLDHCDGNVSKTARVLHIARSALYKRLTELGIHPRGPKT